MSLIHTVFRVLFLNNRSACSFSVANTGQNAVGIQGEGEMLSLPPKNYDCVGRAQGREGSRTPWFNGWGFNLPRGQSLLDKWNLIPEGIDILMTHGPPLGFRDWVPKELQRVGCVELLNTVQRRVRPKLHVFGGIHEGYGIMTDGYTTYINASTCTVSFQPTNPPIIFDLPNPQGS
ncbi:metallophosphoesterase MPPED2-like [Eumetopias jubatus]|uniref:metallophosphoesterase MPPED2-like n=2 Tax=Eumetopias jubatus TaxID=34886 RepID=UPI00101636E6|nr:metallophosphoesterase MPPED2-like [Eumetopias jubatus]